MKTHRVLKHIPGCDAEIGSEVDASEWRNAPNLEKQRFIKPLDAVAAPDGQQSEASFDERVIAAVKADIERGGELSQLFTSQIAPSVRGKRSQPKEA